MKDTHNFIITLETPRMNKQFLRVDSIQADSMTRLKMTDRNRHVPVGRDKDSCSLSQKDIICGNPHTIPPHVPLTHHFHFSQSVHTIKCSICSYPCAALRRVLVWLKVACKTAHTHKTYRHYRSTKQATSSHRLTEIQNPIYIKKTYVTDFMMLI